VEVVTVLDPTEKQAFDGLVFRLALDDPTFVDKLKKLDQRPAHGWRRVLSVLLWTTAPLWIIFGGWTGLLLAVVAVAYAAILTSRQSAGATHGLPRGSTPRPGASY
jgi:hypothetical protein